MLFQILEKLVAGLLGANLFASLVCLYILKLVTYTYLFASPLRTTFAGFAPLKSRSTLLKLETCELTVEASVAICFDALLNFKLISFWSPSPNQR